MTRPAMAALAAVALAAACRDRAETVQNEERLSRMVTQLVPGVERATGLRFKTRPQVARRTRDQVWLYLTHKIDEDLPPQELASYEAALEAFGLLPPGMRLRNLLLDVLKEQVVGYYDPDSMMLYVAADVDSFFLRTTVTHELTHALQGQYLPLDSLVRQRRRNDRRSAAQAVLEGQATLAQTLAMMPELDRAQLPSFWDARSALAQQQAGMKQFADAPLWVREGLIFPYLAGADFVRWYEAAHPGAHPFGRAMPTSTEQILHHDRYAAGDEPTELSFATPAADSVRYEDGLGEFETRLLLQQHLGSESIATLLASGWDGDRYQLLGRGGAEALVWYSVWDDAAAADRFARGLERAWARGWAGGRADRRAEIKRVTIDGRPGVRLVDAPAGWSGWKNIPRVSLTATGG
ncbi:MAG TPA: DUF6782 family putative metallopeptidase [Gemmatimonadales bacterium]